MDCQFVSWSLKEPWRFLGILGQLSTTALERNPLLWNPFLRAAVQFWPIFSAAGPRYSMGSSHGKDLWQLPTNLRFVLAGCGVSTRSLPNLPAGGLAELVMPLLAATEH